MTKRAKTAKTAKTTPAAATTLAAVTTPATALLVALGACAVGALAMFLLDSASGRRRRALIRDKALQAGREVSESISKGSRDVRQRVEAMAIETGKRLRGASGREEPVEQRDVRANRNLPVGATS